MGGLRSLIENLLPGLVLDVFKPPWRIVIDVSADTIKIAIITDDMVIE